MKKLLVLLTIVWVSGIGLLFAGPENIIILAEKINNLAKFFQPYTSAKTWIEAGLIGGAMLLGALWTIFALRKATK